jgi:GTPase SAR1 family protein
MGVEVNPILFNSTEGAIVFNIWDTARQARYSELGLDYLIGAHAVIAMYDEVLPSLPNVLNIGFSKIAKHILSFPLFLLRINAIFLRRMHL